MEVPFSFMTNTVKKSTILKCVDIHILKSQFQLLDEDVVLSELK